MVLNYAFKKQTSQLKKIVLETMNYGLANFTKPKRKLRNTTKYQTFSQYLLFLVLVGLGLIFYFFYIHNIFTTNLRQ